jgi:hypothetical protein
MIPRMKKGRSGFARPSSTIPSAIALRQVRQDQCAKASNSSNNDTTYLARVVRSDKGVVPYEGRTHEILPQ